MPRRGRKYKKTYRTAVGRWRQQFSEVPDLEERYIVTPSQQDESVSKEGGPRSPGNVLEVHRRATSVVLRNWASLTYLPAVQFLLDHRWQPSRALALATDCTFRRSRKAGMSGGWRMTISPDDTCGAYLNEHIRESVRQNIEDVTLKAAILLGKPAEVQGIRSSIEGPVPENRKQRSAYWHRRARLASLGGPQGGRAHLLPVRTACPRCTPKALPRPD